MSDPKLSSLSATAANLPAIPPPSTPKRETAGGGGGNLSSGIDAAELLRAASFAEPSFNVRQWVNTVLPASTLSSSGTPGMSVAERRAAELITHLQLRSQEVSSNLDDAITQTLVRMPRALSEVSRMSAEANRLGDRIGEVRKELSSTYQGGNNETADNAVPAAADGEPNSTRQDLNEVERLQASKEKLRWCHNVLKTAKTLSAELRELEASVEALGRGGGSAGSISIKQSSPNQVVGGDMSDIEHIASLTQNLNANLQQLQAVDPSFGAHYANRIVAAERRLQTLVESEILDSVRHRSSLRGFTIQETERVLVEVGCLQRCAPPPTAAVKPKPALKSAAAAEVATSLVEPGPTPLRSLETNAAVIAHVRRAAAEMVSSGGPNSILSFASKDSASSAASSSTHRGDAPKSEPAAATTTTTTAAFTRGLEVGRTARLLSILRAIDRDAIVLDAFVESGVAVVSELFQHCVAEPFKHFVNSNKSADESDRKLQPSPVALSRFLSGLLIRFYFHLGTTIASEVDYLAQLYLASLQCGRATGLQSVGGDVATLGRQTMGFGGPQGSSHSTAPAPLPLTGAGRGSAGIGGASTSLADLEVLVMDTVSLMVRSSVEAFTAPLKDLLLTCTAATNTHHHHPANQYASAPTEVNAELARCYEAAVVLVELGADVLLPSADSVVVLASSEGPSSNSHLRVSCMMPTALGSTAGRGYSLFVEHFVARERAHLETFVVKGGTGADVGGVSTAAILAGGRGLVAAVEGALLRCGQFFPQETTHPILNTWSRQVAAVCLQLRKPAAEVAQLIKGATSRGEEGLRSTPAVADATSRRATIERMLELLGGAQMLYALLVGVEGTILTEFLGNGPGGHRHRDPTSGFEQQQPPTVAPSVMEIDVLQEIFKQAEKECLNTIASLEATVSSILLSPLNASLTSYTRLPALLIGRGGHTGATTHTNATPFSAAQSTSYSTGNAVYSPTAQSICDFLLEVPDTIGALSVVIERISEKTATAVASSKGDAAPGGPSTNIPAMSSESLLKTVLLETQTCITTRLSSELVAVYSMQSLEQLSVDLDYIAPVLEAVRDDGGTAILSGSSANDDEGADGAVAFDALVARVKEAAAAATDQHSPLALPFFLSGQQQQQQHVASPKPSSQSGTTGPAAAAANAPPPKTAKRKAD